MPKVSIIVPIYNVESYLSQCLDSILAQSFRDYELILVDDGSTDSSGELAERYAASDRRIKQIHKINGGLSSARNAGLDMASGDYIYFADSDDFIDESLLSKTVPYMDKGYDLVAFNYRYVENHLDRSRDSRDPRFIKEMTSFSITTDEERLAFLTGLQTDGTIHWEAWNRVFRRDIIEKHHIRFADNRKIFAEDLFFRFCYDAFISKVLLIPYTLYNYRLRDDSLMGQSAGKLLIREFNELAKAIWAFYSNNEKCRYLSDRFLPVYAWLRNMNLWRLQEIQYKKKLSVDEARDILREEITDFEDYRSRLTEVYLDKNLRDRSFSRSNPRASLINKVFIKEILDIPENPAEKSWNRFLLKITYVLRMIKRRIEGKL